MRTVFPAHRIYLIVAILPWLALLGWLAAVSWFLTDDAFISFRYVRNLLEGHGLVFNVGERVEGYSNFLWVLELAAFWGILGIKPEHAAPWLSVIYTAGTIAALLWWAWRTPSLRGRGLTAWMALGLVCSSATFAVWTSGGGLETRQFTFFVVVAVVCLALYRGSQWGLLTASLSLAAAALTRPEGPLIAALCCGWFAVQRMVDAGRLRLDWRELAFLIAPFAILVVAHFLFRYAYYGEWLPNTYYAKHVRPWYESGFRYLWAAVLETGLYLLLPLAVVALRERWREYRDGTCALILLIIVVHIAYVMRIGGDHFEYRPLDFYWPLLALPAAVGIVHLGGRIAGQVQRIRTMARVRILSSPPAWALLLFVPVIFYSGAMQAALLFEGAKINERITGIHIELDEDNAGWLLSAPGMPALVAISNDLRYSVGRQTVGSRFVEHREFADLMIAKWQPYENMERGIIPDDAVMVAGSIGVQFYYLPELTVIDSLGLTDATVARNPVTHPNRVRSMAHDRSAPPGYLEERGVNIIVHPLAATVEQAFERGNYAAPVGANLWMPFDSDYPEWVSSGFAGRDLRIRARFSITEPSGNDLLYDGRFYVGERFLGSFDVGLDGWILEGSAVTNHADHALYRDQQPIRGNLGSGFLTSYHPDERDNATGKARSPEFTAGPDQLLAFRIAGGAGDDVGVRLLADGEQVAVWHGRNTERFNAVMYALDGMAGQRLQLELFDNATGGWGHIMLDHVVLMRSAPTT